MQTSWSSIKLNDGRTIPGIAFGADHLENVMADDLVMATKVGFRHFDTAQNYNNEAGVGKGIKQCEIPRSELWITTKWSGMASIPQSIDESLHRLDLEHVDLYLIHSPGFPGGDDIEGTWLQMEGLLKEGKAKSIGVSNYKLDDLQRLLAICTIKPVVNQIFLHPGNYTSNLPLLELMAEHDILACAYSPLWPIRKAALFPGLVKVLADMAVGMDIQPEQVLLAWSKAKGFLPVTTTAKESRAVGYMAAGGVRLSHEDIRRIDQAGADVPL